MPSPKNNKTRKQLRKNRIAILLNDSEIRALQRYCKRYRYNNQSAAIRQLLFTNILKKFDNDQPTLFD
ncbi:MAG: hypothetical protein NC038_04725 [Paludibacter sp.]|nr:hypothetical protein [Bacteroidales bacterium]MCM1069339.1 hypothetical protein [Prevotella sp.]MCM1353859.1 hypothetical protein [Bacteroides sp.]MCM1442891.1 hypothetical protein [Muribaculum sp.]MCM1481936.1 hypothetical protein [Paludibacter sp.]